MKGMKWDQEKAKWYLLPLDIIEEVVKVLTFGARKYADNNWQIVVSEEGGVDRYYSAMMRHVRAWQSGEIYDKETGIHHFAHAMCCAIFIMWYDKQKEKK